MTYRPILSVLILSALALACAADADDFPFRPEARLWKPVQDEVYLQELGEKVEGGKILAVAVYDGVLYAAAPDGVKSLDGRSLVAVDGAPGNVTRLRAAGGALWGMAADGLYRYHGAELQKVDDRLFVDVCELGGAVYGATRADLFRYQNGAMAALEPATGYKSPDTTFQMEDGTQILPEPIKFGPVSRIAAYAGTLYGLRPNEVVLLDGETVTDYVADWGMLPSRNLRDIVRVGNRLYIATDRGLGVLRGMALTSIGRNERLPFEDTTCLAAGFDGDLWIGTTRGAIRSINGEFQYFAAGRWLPGDRVNDIAVGKDVVYIATDGGLGIIRYEPWTLAKKAAFYERHMDEWGHKRLGFIHRLYWGGESAGWLREISDNDGGYTAPYLAAMSFKYAATGDEKAREEAVDSFKAMIWLEEITGVRGLIARAIWSNTGDAGEKAKHGSGGLPARWYPTPDGLWEWKGDTSSDEVSAHYYAVSVFHDFAAQGPEKARATEHIARMTDHIVANGWKLRDANGQTTRWGRFDPDYLLRPYGMESRGLNGLHALAYASTAKALTGDNKYQGALDQLLGFGYQQYTVRQKATFPPDIIVPWDDRLGFESLWPAIKYNTNPQLTSILLRSIERSWEVKRMEHIPWYNFMYGAITGNDCEVRQAVDHLGPCD
ncbi:MAG: hypothetical protein NTZ09_03965 [Candidatus Hydrogenedentes bacterium]|nr:hypothetical protein [Candidatus Hydrogenedentota bacterium]